MTGEQKLQYENQGFVHFPGLLDRGLVERVKRAFDTASANYYEDWQKKVAAGEASKAFYDIPDILDQDDAFVELVDYELLVPILLTTVGADIQLNHTHARVFPPGQNVHGALAQRPGRRAGHRPRAQPQLLREGALLL